MRDFRQGVGLVHKLRQLRGAKELFKRRGNRLGIDEVMRHQWLLLGLTQALFNGLFNTGQTGSVLVFGQLTHAAHTTVAQVVDIVHFATAITQVHQDFDNRQNVFVVQDHLSGRFAAAYSGIELHATHT